MLSLSVVDPRTATGESHRFSCLFDRTAKLRSRFARDGTGVWGSEVTDHSEIAYLEHMRIKPEYRGQGIGAWALKELYKASDGIRVAVRRPNSPPFLRQYADASIFGRKRTSSSSSPER